MPDFLSRWAVPITGAIMVTILILVILGFEPARSTFCKPDDICLRDWLSALSGWVALAAAIAAIAATHKQRQESAEHQRQFVELEIMGRLALARRVQHDFVERYLRLAILQHNIRSPRDETEDIQGLIKAFNELKEAVRDDLNSALFREYSDKIGFVGTVDSGTLETDYAYAERAIETYMTLFSSTETTAREYEIRRKHVLNLFMICEDHTEVFYSEFRLATKSFTERWQTMI